MGSEMCIRDSLHTKEPFFDYKRKISESPKNLSFPKVLAHAFGQKIPNFSFFGFGQKKPRKNALKLFRETRNVFLTIKTKIFESPKNRTFPKGLTHAIG